MSAYFLLCAIMDHTHLKSAIWGATSDNNQAFQEQLPVWLTKLASFKNLL